MNARRAIGAFGFLIDFMDPFSQLLIRLGSCRRLSLTPGVLANGIDLVRTHKLKNFGGTASVSRAN